MSTYRFGKYKTWDGTSYYNIEKKTFFGWSEEKCWITSHVEGLIIVKEDSVAKSEMMESVDRLVKAGHTVL